MGRYVDAYVAPVVKDRLEEYRQIAELAGKIWREHGALEYVECIAEDVQPGKLTSFPQSVDLQPGEIVVFAYVIYESREARDRVLELVMQDPRMNCENPPFDGKRLFWGGFEKFVEA